jgi:hypothetical protein
MPKTAKVDVDTSESLLSTPGVGDLPYQVLDIRAVASTCWVSAWACILLLVASSGCASAVLWVSGGWAADYQLAEQRARESGREMLILYKDARPGVDGPIERALKSPPVKARIGKYAHCVLFKPHEPDRRYVAQFGVDRAPALIVVHADGTYHAHTGAMSAQGIIDFLDNAQEPGAQPVVNQWVPREPRYDWFDGMNAAKEAAERTGQPILIVYYRYLSRDWQRLEPLLMRREVYSRLADMVHCRIGTANPWASAYITPYGALKLPAIVIARSGGAYDVLALPTSYETIVRFADAALRGREDAEAEPTASGPAAPTTGGR